MVSAEPTDENSRPWRHLNCPLTIDHCPLSIVLEVVGITYQDYGTKKRTLLQMPLLFAGDLQALPPWGWCEECGKEVYERGAKKCRRCKRNGELAMPIPMNCPAGMNWRLP